jgi:hypothetical protein
VLRRYVATYEYIEVVGGEPREFVHETIIEAIDKDDAMRVAHRQFQELALRDGVGWKRVLNRYGVISAPYDPTSRGGGTVYAEAGAEES